MLLNQPAPAKSDPFDIAIPPLPGGMPSKVRKQYRLLSMSAEYLLPAGYQHGERLEKHFHTLLQGMILATDVIHTLGNGRHCWETYLPTIERWRWWYELLEESIDKIPNI